MQPLVPDQRLEPLQAWLGQGWQIEQPVLQRSALRAAMSQICGFEAIVIRKGERRVIALNDGPDVFAFFDQHQVDVVSI